MSDRPDPQNFKQIAFENVSVAGDLTVGSITQTIILQESQKAELSYSDPVPKLRFFQGRRAELADLHTWLADPTVSMIGIRGEGGIGKSTLMARVFSECPGFVGKFWADVRTGPSIAELVAQALKEFGVSPEEVNAIEEKDLIPRLLRLLQTKRYLIAIDNLETVLTSAGEWQSGYELLLEGIQDFSSQSVLLLASREYPPKYFGWQQSQWLTVEHGLEPTEGAALLAALAVEDTLENRAEMSERLQGNPLALTLVAGWLRETYRRGDRLVSHLAQHTDLLQVSGRHRGEKQISVDWVMEWSIGRLTLEQQYLLTQISVFRNAFNVEAATAVAAQPNQQIGDADLDDLERRSLVQALTERDKHGMRTFRLQPRVREFVQKRANDLTTAYQKAIAHSWQHRQTEFPANGMLEEASEYQEVFYYQCQLKQYQDAAETLFVCDSFLRRRGYYQTLIGLYSQLHADWQPALEQRKTFAAICGNLGNAYDSLGQYEQAVHLHKQHLKIAREIADRHEEASALCNLGGTYRALGQYENAIQFHQHSLQIEREIGNQKGEAISLANLGNVYQCLGQYKRAIDFHQESLAIKRALGDRREEASSLGSLGNAYDSLGQYKQAIHFHQQYLEISRTTGDRQGEAYSLCNLGLSYEALGDYKQAGSLYQQSLEVAREIGDQQTEANNLCNLGNIYQSVGQYDRAIQHQQESLKLAQKIGDRQGEASSLCNLGLLYQAIGQFEQAIQNYQQCLEIARAIGDRQVEANTLGGLGSAYLFSGQYEKAIDLYQQSLEITLEIGDRQGEACSLYNLGNAHQFLEQSEQANSFHQQALEIARTIGDRQREADALCGLGNAHSSSRQFNLAITFYQQSLEIALQIGDPHGEANSLGNLGSVYASLKEYKRAIDFHQQALNIERKIGNKQGEADTLLNIGDTLENLSCYSEALESYKLALSIYEDLELSHMIEKSKTIISECSKASTPFNRILRFVHQRYW